MACSLSNDMGWKRLPSSVRSLEVATNVQPAGNSAFPMSMAAFPVSYLDSCVWSLHIGAVVEVAVLTLHSTRKSWGRLVSTSDVLQGMQVHNKWEI